MNKFQIAWAVWVLWFIVWEYFAVTNGVRGDTLSEQVWFLAGTDADRNNWNWFFRIALGVGIAWLIPHFMTGWFWWNK